MRGCPVTHGADRTPEHGTMVTFPQTPNGSLYSYLEAMPGRPSMYVPYLRADVTDTEWRGFGHGRQP